MSKFFKALNTVCNLSLQSSDRDTGAPSDWLLVLARGSVSLVYVLAAGLVLWLMPQNRLVAALLATVAAVALRNYIFPHTERSGLVEVASHLAPMTAVPSEQNAFKLAIFNLVLVARPICIFVLLIHCNFLWLTAAAALGYAVAIASVKEDAPGEWVSACAVALLVGAITSKIGYAFSGMFFISIIACVICWLLSFAIARIDFKDRFNCTLYIGETAALILGMVGQAF